MIDNKLQLFLEKELLTKWSKKIIFTPQMKLYKDFGLEGEDAEDFLLHFTKEFKVNFDDKFNFRDRFYLEFEEGFIKNLFAPFISIFSFVTNKKAPKLKDLSIGELQEAINTGVLK
ncbi:DUF1493 family protein [Apibacter muscae]|nr:DUF1493 family protein [Apibacter muscae]